MGSLFKTSTPRYAPTTYAPVKGSAENNPTPDTEDKTVSDGVRTQQAQDAIRRVARNRGVGSTILTSFRGVLGDRSSLAPQRKNLLGE